MTELLRCKVEAYRRKDFSSLGLFGKQLEAMEHMNDDTVRECLYGGSARSGKSWFLCLWKIMTRLAYSGSRGLIAREEMTKLRDTTQKTFFLVADDLGLIENLDYTFLGGKDVYFYNGSVEMFRELKYLPIKDPQFDRIGSYDLTDAALDEAQQIHWKAPDVLKGRYSVLTGVNKYESPDGKVSFVPWRLTPKAFYSCNPAKNWIYTKFYQPHKQKTLEDYKRFVPALPTDNPHVEESFLEGLRTAERVTKERLLYGNFDYDDDPDSMCDYEAICDIFTNTHITAHEGDRWLVTDLAMKGRDAFIAMSWEGNVGKVALKKNQATGKSIEDDLRHTKDELHIPNSHIIADADGLGSYLSSYIVNIKEFHGGAASHDKKFGNLKDECAYKLAEKINKRELRIICSFEDQEEIKRQLSICLKRDPKVDDEKSRLMKKSIQKEKLGGSPDFLDVLIMRQMPEVVVEYDIIM